MKMKIFLIIFLFISGIIQISYLNAEKVASFEEIAKPETFVFGNGYIYVLERTTIFIYDQKTYKYIGKFGKEGEGPEEIKKNPFSGPLGVTPFKGNVIISSMAKVSFFTKDGKFIREQRVSPSDTFFPFGDNYICMGQATKDDNKDLSVLSVFFADKNLKKGSVLYKSDFQIGQNFKFVFPMVPFYPVVQDDTLFIIAGKEGFSINKYNIEGKQKGKIFKKVKQLKLSSDYKNKTIKWFRTDPNYKNFWSFMKQRISFSSTYPQIYAMFSGKNRLYVLTNEIKGDKRECIVMDFSGKEIKRLFLYAPELYGFDYQFITNLDSNYYYWLVEEEENEVWELHREKIE